jgi:hypothetical protein
MAGTATRTNKRYHDNELVHGAVEKYAEAIYARTDIDDREKELAVERYTESMRDIWGHPDRGGNKKS